MAFAMRSSTASATASRSAGPKRGSLQVVCGIKEVSFRLGGGWGRMAQRLVAV
jgi:hypothetical protein